MTPSNKIKFTHVRDLTAYYALEPLREVIVPLMIQKFGELTSAGMKEKMALWEVICELDNPAMSREFHRLTFDEGKSYKDAWEQALKAYPPSSTSCARKRRAVWVYRESTGILRVLKLQLQDAKASIPPHALGRFKDHGIVFKSTDPCVLLSRAYTAKLAVESGGEGQEFYEAAVNRLARFVQMILSEVADHFLDRDNRSLLVDTLVRERVSHGDTFVKAWVVMATDPNNFCHVVRKRRLRVLDVADVTFKCGTKKRLTLGVNSREVSPTRVFTSEADARRYANDIRYHQGLEAVVHFVICTEVAIGDKVYLVEFDGRPKDKYGDARRGERKLTEDQGGRREEDRKTHAKLWPENAEDSVGIQHNVVGVKQATPVQVRKDRHDAFDDLDVANLNGIPFCTDPYRVATRKDVKVFRDHCKEVLWSSKGLVYIRSEENGDGGPDRSPYFWNVTLLGVVVVKGVGYGLEHQFLTIEDSFDGTNALDTTGHKVRRAAQNQRDLRVMYGVDLTDRELRDWKDYISVLSRKKELD